MCLTTLESFMFLDSMVDLVRRHGLMRFTQIVWGRLSPFEELKFQKALRENKPYLGEYLSARQGKESRRHYMALAIEAHVRTNPNNHIEILEIGSWAGGSAITFGNAIKKYAKSGTLTCVDLWEPFYSERDGVKNAPTVASSHIKDIQTGKIFDLFKHNIKASGLADIVDAKKTRFENFTTSKQFDVIYIDGDHRYSAVMHDIAKAISLLKVGGFICGDDLEKQYHEVDQDFCNSHIDTDFVYEGKVSKTYIHPGVTKAVYDSFKREVSEYDGFWIMKKVSEHQFEKLELPARHSSSVLN
jgi:hypothetical protein